MLPGDIHPQNAKPWYPPGTVITEWTDEDDDDEYMIGVVTRFDEADAHLTYEIVFVGDQVPEEKRRGVLLAVLDAAANPIEPAEFRRDVMTAAAENSSTFQSTWCKKVTPAPPRIDVPTFTTREEADAWLDTVIKAQ